MSAAPLVPGTIAEYTNCLLIKVGQVMFRLTEENLGPLGLRVRHYSILQALADNGPMSQLSLGAFLRIDPATMVSSLDDLERAELAARARDPLDRRRHVVQITAAGRDLLAEVSQVFEGWDERAFADLSATDRRSLFRILTKLASGPTLAALFDASRDQAGSRKMSSAKSPVAPAAR